MADLVSNQPKRSRRRTIGIIIAAGVPVWIAAILASGLLLPGQAAQIVPVALVIAGIVLYPVILGVQSVFAALHERDSLWSVSGADALSLVVASALFGYETHKRFPSTWWVFPVTSIIVFCSGTFLILRQARLVREMYEDSLLSEEQKIRYERFQKNPIVAIFGDRSAIIAVYVVVVGLIFVIPDSWPSWSTAASLAVAIAFIGLWNRFSAPRKTRDEADSDTGPPPPPAEPQTETSLVCFLIDFT